MGSGSLLLFFEVLILKDVRRSADEAKANTLIAGLAVREGITGNHDDLVGGTMLLVVNDLVDSGLTNHITGLVTAERGWSATASSGTFAARKVEADAIRLLLWGA